MNEVFHHIRCCGKTFTFDEWGDYCAKTRNGEQRIETTFGKYTFNDNDICLNPDSVEFNIKKGSYGCNAAIKYADCGNGLWSFGLDYSIGTAGGGYGVSWADRDTGDGWRRGYHTKEECLIAACVELLNRLSTMNEKGKPFNDLVGAVAEYRRSIGRPKVVQLELF